MSDLKQIMLRLESADYEALRLHAYRARAPLAVLARVLVKQRLDDLERERFLTERTAHDYDPAQAPEIPLSPASPRRSSNAKRSKKNKKRQR